MNARAGCVVLVMVAACGPATPPVSTGPGQSGGGSHPDSGEGIYGTVAVATGDFMPSTDGEASNGKVTPAANAKVRVFRGLHWKVEKLDPGDSALVATVTPDVSGHYFAALPPGDYTAVMEDSQGVLHLNCFSDDLAKKITSDPPAGDADAAVWCAVVVKAGDWTRADIEDNSQATY